MAQPILGSHFHPTDSFGVSGDGMTGQQTVPDAAFSLSPICLESCVALLMVSPTAADGQLDLNAWRATDEAAQEAARPATRRPQRRHLRSAGSLSFGRCARVCHRRHLVSALAHRHPRRGCTLLLRPALRRRDLWLCVCPVAPDDDVAAERARTAA